MTRSRPTRSRPTTVKPTLPEVPMADAGPPVDIWPRGAGKGIEATPLEETRRCNADAAAMGAGVASGVTKGSENPTKGGGERRYTDAKFGALLTVFSPWKDRGGERDKAGTLTRQATADVKTGETPSSPNR